MANRIRELRIFLLENNINIALISETHTTRDSFLRMPDCSAYCINHISGKARDESALFVNTKIRHFSIQNFNEEYIQTTTVRLNNKEVKIFAAYCPPQYNIQKHFIEIFKKLGKRFVIAGDFNAKHTT